MARKEKQERGIVLLAGLHHTYATAAMGLIATIRNKDPQIPILLYLTEGVVNAERERLLEGIFKVQVRYLDAECYTTAGRNTFVKAKTYLYDLSPFHKTLYLDVDMAFLPRKTATELMLSLDGVPFTAISEGYYDNVDGDKTSGFYTFWTDVQEVREKYPAIDRIYQLRSEMLYFEKSPQTKKLFRLAKGIYNRPLTHVAKIGGTIPDEYAFNIASALTGLYPHDPYYQPVFWEFRRTALRQPTVDESLIMSRYYAYSVGGNRTEEKQKTIYERLIKGSMNTAGMAHLAFKLIDKSQIPALNRKIL